MALSKRHQYLELMREWARNAPTNLPPELEATALAAIAAYASQTKEKKKKWRLNVALDKKEELASKLSNMPSSLIDQLHASLVAEIEEDTEVN